MKCDASHLGLGASIEQDHRGNWKTVAFASKFLNIAELKYSTNELELLGLVWALDHFKNYLLGKQFSILTDHKALTGALKDDKYRIGKSYKYTPRLRSFDAEKFAVANKK